jgi:ATP-dependent 26S proteasome regulatory subunit
MQQPIDVAANFARILRRDPATRAEILRIHAGKRSLQLTDPEVMQLSSRCDGFSGAEIEQAVVSAVYAAHAAGRTVGAPDILREIDNTRPLSVVMGEKVAELREWAAERTVPAN